MFKGKTGFRQHLLSDDPAVRQGVLNWLDRVLGYYGEDGGVDIEVIRDQVLLNARSATYLYSDYTPLTLRYKRGSRPLLEEVVASVTRPRMRELDRMLALMRRCRDNRDYMNPAIQFNGGSEEELLKRGAIICNEIHRVFVCLCQIAGMPARLMSAHISGHMMSEVYVNRRWMWVDCMKGNYCFNDDGAPASAWDLMRDPSLIDRQQKKIWKDCRPILLTDLPAFLERDRACCQAKIRECYFHPREAVAIGNYFVWDHARYTYPWRAKPADPTRRAAARMAEARHRRKWGWPDHYFDTNLFDGTLRTRI